MFIGVEDDNMTTDERIRLRSSDLSDLFEEPSLQPVLSSDRPALIEQYKDLFFKALNIVDKLKSQVNLVTVIGEDSYHSTLFKDNGQPKCKKTVNNAAWYEICSEEENCKDLIGIITFAFEFLIRDGNECSVESLIGDIKHVKDLRRNRLNYDNMLRQLFIRRNGPHPLLSKTLRMKALKAMDPEPRFITRLSIFSESTSSATYMNRVKAAKLDDNYCFD